MTSPSLVLLCVCALAASGTALIIDVDAYTSRCVSLLVGEHVSAEPRAASSAGCRCRGPYPPRARVSCCRCWLRVPTMYSVMRVLQRSL